MRNRIHAHIRANVVGYIAIFMFAIGGTAYATHPGGTNTISTEDIINGQVMQPDIGASSVNGLRILNQSVKDEDLAPGTVKGSKVEDGSLTGADVNESSLDLSSHFAAAADTGTCNDDNQDGDVCASAPIFLDQSGRLLLNGSGTWHSASLDDASGAGSDTDETDAVTGTCTLRVDGAEIGTSHSMGEDSPAAPNRSHPSPHAGTMAQTALSGGLSAGAHTAEVFCTELDGDIDWNSISLTAIRVDNIPML